MIDFSNGKIAIDISIIHISGNQYVMYPVLIALIFLYIRSLIWVTKDARKRGKSPILAIIFVSICSWPISLLWWTWFYPIEKEGLYRASRRVGNGEAS
jgi:hypothetical protein